MQKGRCQIMQIHFEKVAQRLSPAIGFLAFALGLPAQSCAQTSGVPQWSGIWNAEGSLLTLRVTHIDDQLHVEPVESLGFQWRNSVGQINGSSATIDVEYQKATTGEIGPNGQNRYV